MYYGDTTSDKLQRRYRKFYSEDGSMEITNDTQAGSTGFVFYLGGDAYSAPAIWKEVHTSAAVVQNLYFLHRDHLGSILMITDVNGNIAEKRQFDAWGNIVKLEDGNGNALTAFVILDRGYTGHEHLFGVALINMNARLYDPVLHRFLSPDNFVQDPSNTQNFNRYGYVMNNPLSRVDKDGKFIHIIIGAVVGGVFNLTVKAFQGKIHGFKDGLVAFGIGAVAGGLGAATGGAALAASGFTVTSIAGGAIAGAAGAAVASPVQGLGNMAYFGDKYSFKSWGKDVLLGGIFGGIAGGISNRLQVPGARGNIFTGQIDPTTGVSAESLQMTKFGDNLGVRVDPEKINLDHAFGNRASSYSNILGGDQVKITSEVVKNLQQVQPMLLEGPNTILTKIAGQSITIRCFVQSGEVISANIFNGESSRILGNLINLR